MGLFYKKSRSDTRLLPFAFCLLPFAFLFVGLPATRAEAPDTRAEALLQQMTLEEKIGLLSGDRGGFSTRAIPRLGIPKLVMADGPQGVRNYGPACALPCGSALAATWDVGLAESYGRVIGRDGRARGVNFQLGPGVNICRTPVNGRNFEYFGEDPYLAGKTAAAWVRGLQGEGVIATVKHYACNNQETDRNSVDVQLDERTLHEIYLPVFRRAVQEGGAWAIMAAYNRVLGSYCSENELLLHEVLKKEWGFPGVAMSDWGAVHSMAALARGLDLEMPSGRFFNETAVKQALAAGTVTQANIDDSVRRLLRAAVAMGFLDRTQKRSDLPLDSPDSAKAALDIARAAIVLLKNDGSVLPLDRSRVRRIAVYGPNAEETPVGGGGSGAVRPFHSVSFLNGIRTLAGTNVEVTSVPMPVADPAALSAFKGFRTAPGGEPGLKLEVQVEGDNPTDHPSGGALPPSVVPSIDLSQASGSLPVPITPGQRARFTWSGVVVAPVDGDWELMATGRAQVWLGGREVASPNGYVLHLAKDRPVPIRVEAQTGSNTPFDARAASNGGPFPSSGRRPTFGRFTPAARIGLRPFTLPDLAPARQADAVVFCGGLNSRVESEGRDRDFDLPPIQQHLIAALAGANRRTIVVLNGGAAVGMESWQARVPAILQAWYLGQEGGTALGEVLFGDVNPSGRLPSTFDRRLEENPSTANYPGELGKDAQWPAVQYREGLFIGYRGYDRAGKAPLFPFGYGQSYTSFRLAHMKLARSGDGVHVALDVTNTGKRAGAEVVQIYVGQPKCSVERPLRELKGFTKVALQPGETRQVELLLPRDSFAFWSPAKKDWAVEPGPFVIEAGASSRSLPCRGTISLEVRESSAQR